jgi:hypothetical protein
VAANPPIDVAHAGRGRASGPGRSGGWPRGGERPGRRWPAPAAPSSWTAPAGRRHSARPGHGGRRWRR